MPEKKSLFKRIKHRIELVGVWFLLLLPSILPLKLAVKLGGTLGIIAFDIFRVRRKISLENLKRAFGDKYSEKELKSIARRSYVNFAKSMVEFASLRRFSRDREKLVRLVKFDGLEILDSCLERGKGVLTVTGHFGSWELMGAAVSAMGYPVDFLVGEQSNTLVDNLINDLRRSAGIGIISRGIAAKGVFRSLKNNRVVALLSDQDARRSGIFVDFFSTPASTFQGAAQFSYRSSAPIVCCFIVRNPDETHRVVFTEPIEPNCDADKESEIERLTQEHTKVLEQFVTRYPDHYFWSHRRWKTKPPEKMD